MGLRLKTILLISLSLAILVGTLAIVFTLTLDEKFEELEQKKTETNVERAVSALQSREKYMLAKIIDWANWDDTCEFMLTKSQKFIESNISFESIMSLDLNYIAFIDTQGSIVYDAMLNEAKGELIKGHPSLNAWVQKNNLLFNFADIEKSYASGIAIYDDSMPAMLFVAKPILDSEFKGPSRGTLVFARLIDEKFTASLNDTLHLNVGIFKPDAPELSFLTPVTRRSLLNPGKVEIVRNNNSKISGLATISDYFGKAALILKTQEERDIYQQGKQTRSIILWTLLTVGVVVSIFIGCIVEKSILSRLSAMHTAIMKVKNTADLSITIPNLGSDEIGAMADAMNHMFKNLDAAQKDMDKLRVKAEEASVAKSNFLANMSHEIRTPMNGVTGMAELLLGTELDEQQFEFTKMIKQSSDALLSIINNILDISKIEAGKFDLSHEPFSLRSFLKKSQLLFSVVAKQNKLELVIDVASNVPNNLIGDESRLGQIITNLLSNAMKFAPSGGRVVVKVELVQEIKSVVTLSFAISDNGIGISAEKLSAIFEPFTQADSSITKKYGGTGLGLAIVQQIASLMQGTVSLTSTPGIGTTFVVKLPFELDKLQTNYEIEPDRAISERKSASYPKYSSSHPLLVVEDSPVNQKLMQTLLKRRGLEVLIAVDGLEAINLLNKQKFSMILMDCQMPVLDGFEATRLIRANEFKTGTHLPIIALTANAICGDKEKCIEAGMDDYLTKPTKIEELDRILTRYLKLSPP